MQWAQAMQFRQPIAGTEAGWADQVDRLGVMQAQTSNVVSAAVVNPGRYTGTVRQSGVEPGG
jgi:hypothetical protein